MSHATHRIGPFDLVHLIRALGRRHFEGVLHLGDAAAAREVRLFFVGGAPAWCTCDDVRFSFAAHALRNRLAPAETLRGLLRKGEGAGVPFEDLLLKEGVLDEARLLAERAALSNQIFERTMAAATLDYRVEWTRTGHGARSIPVLDPWASFFRVVAAGANADFQRSYVGSRRLRRLRPTQQLHVMLPQVQAVMGDVARALAHQSLDGVTAAAALEATGGEAAIAALFALLHANLVSCADARGAKDGADVEPGFPGIEPPAAAPEQAEDGEGEGGDEEEGEEDGEEEGEVAGEDGAALPLAASAAAPAADDEDISLPLASGESDEDLSLPLAGAEDDEEALPLSTVHDPDTDVDVPVQRARTVGPPQPPAPERLRPARAPEAQPPAAPVQRPAAAPRREAPAASRHAAPVTRRAQGGAAAGAELGAALPLRDPEAATGAAEADADWAQTIAVEPPRDRPEHGDASIENALSETFLKLERANAYRALDVPKDACFSQIRDAHQRLRRKYDESMYRTFVLGRRGHQLLAEIGRLLDRAVRVLTDPRLRPAHDQKLGIGDGSPSAELQSAFKAEAACGTGLRHAKAQDWDSAAMAFKAAIELYPKDAAYHAHYAWALFRGFRAGSTSEPDTVQRVWTQLTHALELNPRLTVTHLFRARIAKETGDVDAAIESWQKVLTAAPEHQEAQTELRMLREAGHRRKPAKPAKTGGMLGGLFRRGSGSGR